VRLIVVDALSHVFRCGTMTVVLSPSPLLALAGMRDGGIYLISGTRQLRCGPDALVSEIVRASRVAAAGMP
jgi:hypothetical protein